MPKISRKRPRDGQEASRSSIRASTGTVIPGDLSELSISELKNLYRERNFTCTGGRRVLVKRLENERNRRTQSTSQASITTNNTTSVPTERESLTNIEEWTTAFNTYMIIIVPKSPNRASELLQFMEIIRHAAKAHGGLGWCIYDHKFRHKAAVSRTILVGQH